MAIKHKKSFSIQRSKSTNVLEQAVAQGPSLEYQKLTDKFVDSCLAALCLVGNDNIWYARTLFMDNFKNSIPDGETQECIYNCLIYLQIKKKENAPCKRKLMRCVYVLLCVFITEISPLLMVQFIKTKYQVKPTFLWKETSADKYNLLIISEREENSPND